MLKLRMAGRCRSESSCNSDTSGQVWEWEEWRNGEKCKVGQSFVNPPGRHYFCPHLLSSRRQHGKEDALADAVG